MYKHILPIFIAPKGTLDANLGYFKLNSDLQSVHLHSAPGANDATMELITGEFKTAGHEADFRKLNGVLALPHPLEQKQIAAEHHAVLAASRHLGALPTDSAYQIRMRVRAAMQVDF